MSTTVPYNVKLKSKVHSCDDGITTKDLVWEMDAKFLTMAIFGNDKAFGLNKGAYDWMVADSIGKFSRDKSDPIIESSYFIWDPITGKVWCKDSSGNPAKELDVLGDGKPLKKDPSW